MNTNDGARIQRKVYYLEVDGLAGVPITYSKPADAIEDARDIVRNKPGSLIRLLGVDHDYVFRDGAFVSISRLDQRIVTMLRRILGSNADGHLSVDEAMVIRAAMDELSGGRDRIRATFSRREFATVIAALNHWQLELESGDFSTDGPNFRDVDPLTAREVDALCVRISAGTEHPQQSTYDASKDGKDATARPDLRGTLERMLESLSDLSVWMRSNTGPSDGTMDMLITADKVMSDASVLLGVRR